jgi:hypothetical protein
MFFQLIILLLMSWVVVQDFRYRAVHWTLFPLLFAAFFFMHWLAGNLGNALYHFGLNLLFIGVQWSALTIYFSIKNRKLINILDRYLGWGDLLLFVVFAIAFQIEDFIFFLVGSFLLTLLIYLGKQLLLKKSTTAIPLAGWLGIFYVLGMAVKTSFSSGEEGSLSLFFLSFILPYR